MKIQLLIFLFGILISCKQETERSTKAPSNLKIDQKSGKIIEDDTTVAKELNQDSLVIVWELKLKNIYKIDKRFELNQEPYVNHNDSTLIDTIKSFTFKNSSINVYKAQNFEAIMDAKITDTEIEILNYLKVGAKKYHIEKSLATGISNDQLKIENLEQTSVFTLKFELGQLTAIEFEGYVD